MTVVQREHAGAPRILIAPRSPRPTMQAAIERSGGVIIERPELAEALIWLDPRDPSKLPPSRGWTRDSLGAAAIRGDRAFPRAPRPR